MTREQVKLAAMQLDRADRILLIDELQGTVLTDQQRQEIDQAAIAESERRYQLYKADPSRGRTLEQVLEFIDKLGRP